MFCRAFGGQMTHHIGKYGDIGNFSGVSSICYSQGTWAPTNKIIGDIPVLLCWMSAISSLSITVQWSIVITESGLFSRWRNFCHWLHRNLSKWQLRAVNSLLILFYNKLRPGQDRYHFADDIFKCIFWNGMFYFVSYFTEMYSYGFN